MLFVSILDIELDQTSTSKVIFDQSLRLSIDFLVNQGIINLEWEIRVIHKDIIVINVDWKITNENVRNWNDRET